MSATPIFIVDNRQIQQAEFGIQSALLAFNNNLKHLIGRYVSLSQEHRWIKPVQVLLSAQSADKSRLAILPDLSQLQSVLDLQHYCDGAQDSVANRTWSKYLLDALMKCLNYVHQRRSKEKYSITIYASDVSLFGSQESMSIAESLKKFFQCIREIRWLARVDVRIVCTVISDTSDSQNHQNNNLRNLQQMILVNKTSVGGDEVILQQVLNSNMHFDEELRYLIGQSVTPVPMSLIFPTVLDAQCSCALHLTGATLSAMDALHSGMNKPDVWSLVPRGEMDPLYLEGRGLVVRCDATSSENKQSNHQNHLVYQSLMNTLAQKDVLLVLKIHNKKQECDEFWALVPPAAAAAQDSDAIDKKHMVLLKLADRDSVVLDMMDLVTPEEVQVDNSTNGDPIEEEEGEEEQDVNPLQGHQSTSRSEEDAMVLAETSEYLEQSLFASGAVSVPARFNPMMCDSGSTQAQYQDAMRKTHKGLSNSSSRSGGGVVSPKVNTVDLVENEEVNGIMIQTKKGASSSSTSCCSVSTPSSAKKITKKKQQQQQQKPFKASGKVHWTEPREDVELGEVDDTEEQEDGFATPPLLRVSNSGFSIGGRAAAKTIDGRGNAKGGGATPRAEAKSSRANAPPLPRTAASDTTPPRLAVSTAVSVATSPKRSTTVQEALSEVIRNANAQPVEETASVSRETEEADLYDQAALTSLATLTSLTPHQQQLARTLVNKQMTSPPSPTASKLLKRKYAVVGSEGPKDMFQNSFY